MANRHTATGLAARTLQRAKRALGIKNRRVFFDDRLVSYWFLPGQEPPRGPGDEVVNMLADLDEKYPRPTPLDEDDLDID